PFRGVGQKHPIYNQDLSDRSVLIEIGGVDNDSEELQNTAEALAEVLGEYMNNAIKVNKKKHSLNLRDTITFSLASLFLYSYSANQPSNKLRHLILIPNKTIYKYFVYYELEHTYSLLIGQDRKGFGNNGSTIVFSISDNHPAFLRYYL